MKVTRAQKIRLGIFLAGAIGLLVVSLVTLAGVSLLRKTDEYFLTFTESVSGLEVGAPVKIRGVSVGAVTRIGIDKESEHVRVDVELDHGTKIHVDARATVSSVGITGLKYIDVDPGTPDAALIPPDTEIPTIPSGFAAFTGKAESIAAEVEGLLAAANEILSPENRAHMSETMASVQRTLGHVEDYLSDNRENVRRLVAGTASATEELERTLRELTALTREARPVVAAAERLVNELTERVARLPLEGAVGELHALVADTRRSLNGARLDETLLGMRSMVGKADLLAQRLEQMVAGSDEDLRATFAALRRASRDLELVLREVRSQPSVLIRGRADDP